MLERMEISVIPQDLSHEETIVQISEVLDDLSFAVSHIFDSLNKKISENDNRLQGVQRRASKLQDQLHRLQTDLSGKAVKVYSAAKYPASHIYKEYKLAIQPAARQSISKYSIYKSSVPLSNKRDSQENANKKDMAQQMVNLQEKLQYYYVISKPNKTQAPKLHRNKMKNISSIGALLPFDAGQPDPRETFHVSDNQTSKKSKIEDAPDSILQPWHASDIESPSTYLYTPTLGEVPLINVPQSLPYLPGIVDNERFTLDTKTQNSIAPSSVPLPKLPVEQTIEEKWEKPIVAPVIQEAPLAKPVTQTTPIPSPPIPPPPPPPVPPPPPPQDVIEKQEAISQAPKKPKPKSSTDDRSELMAAIRNAGGVGKAKLKQTASMDKDKDRWSSASVGGDLMSDLRNVLSLRRKGIAGSATNALIRMSSMIPPPPKPNENSSDKNSATSDSQADDDWEE